MADRSDKPRAHQIEAAKSDRSTCETCQQPIAKGELRLSEAFVTDEGRWAKSHQYARSRPREYREDDDRRHENTNPDVWARFHHLACAAQSQPYKLKSALAHATVAIPERAALEAAIERALSAVDAAEEDPATRGEYEQFIRRLRDKSPERGTRSGAEGDAKVDDPDDELLLVFADWLQSVSDPRGELIMVQKALETAVNDERLRLYEAEKKLLAQHRKRLVPERLDGTPTWRRGFIHRLVLHASDPVSLERAFAHPSLRLLRELVVETDAFSTFTVAAILPTPLPATLRVLELDERLRATSSSAGLGKIGPLLAGSVPQLERLKLGGAADLDDVKHPTLQELEIASGDANRPAPATSRGEPRTLVERLTELERRRLPGLQRLILRVDHGLDAALAAVAQTNIVKGLHTLALHGDLTSAGIGQLTDLKRVKLAVIDIRGTQLAHHDVDRLKKLAASITRDELVAAAAAPAAKKVGEWLVRHTRKPEWGIGKVVAELDDGLEIEFAQGGKKQVRNVELLEEVEAAE